MKRALLALLIIAASVARAEDEVPEEEEDEESFIVPPTAPKPKTPAASAEPALVEPDPTPEPEGEAPKCDFANPPQRDGYFVCIVARNGRLAEGGVVPVSGAVLLPNKTTYVRVHHLDNQRVTVELRGETGIYTPHQRASRGPQQTPRWTVTERTLPPFLPSKNGVTITVRLKNRKNETIDELPLGFLVQETYAGALRLGVGVVGRAVNARYSVRTMPGSAQPEIVALTPASAEYELVLGYAAFLGQGRPALGCHGFVGCLAPYVGLGLVGPDDGGLRILPSVHLGAELELGTSFSVALTLVGRQVDRLAPGLVVGGPAGESEKLTERGYALGAGLVFNVSPSFFKFAASGGLGETP